MVDLKERTEIATAWLKQAATTSMVGFRPPHVAPGQLLFVFSVYAPEDAWDEEAMAKFPDWRILHTAVAINADEFLAEDEDQFIETLRERWKVALWSMWHLATKENSKHNLALLEAADKRGELA